MMLYIFIASFVLTQANILVGMESSFEDEVFSNDVAFAAPPAYGSYSLHNGLEAQPTPQPLINLKTSCQLKMDANTLMDTSEFVYDVNGIAMKDISCVLAFEMHKSLYSTDVCLLAYPINENEESLKDVCEFTLCSKCNDDSLLAESEQDPVKEVSSNLQSGFDAAPGFEVSDLPESLMKLKRKIEEAVEGAAPGYVLLESAENIDDASMLIPPAGKTEAIYEEIGMPAPMTTNEDLFEEREENFGLFPPGPVFPNLDTLVDVQLDSSTMKSMVPPGLEINAPITIEAAPRLKRYS